MTKITKVLQSFKFVIIHLYGFAINLPIFLKNFFIIRISPCKNL